jgi:hypothetical protein
MSESKVVTALRAFKENYCWDKSLVTDAAPVSLAPPDKIKHTNTALEDFMNGVRV